MPSLRQWGFTLGVILGLGAWTVAILVGGGILLYWITQ